jgi:hypothetical protein
MKDGDIADSIRSIADQVEGEANLASRNGQYTMLMDIASSLRELADNVVDGG